MWTRQRLQLRQPRGEPTDGPVSSRGELSIVAQEKHAATVTSYFVSTHSLSFCEGLLMQGATSEPCSSCHLTSGLGGRCHSRPRCMRHRQALLRDFSNTRRLGAWDLLQCPSSYVLSDSLLNTWQRTQGTIKYQVRIPPRGMWSLFLSRGIMLRVTGLARQVHSVPLSSDYLSMQKSFIPVST